MIEVTPKAQAQVAAFFEQQKDKARSVRIYLHEGG